MHGVLVPYLRDRLAVASLEAMLRLLTLGAVVKDGIPTTIKTLLKVRGVGVLGCT